MTANIQAQSVFGKDACLARDKRYGRKIGGFVYFIAPRAFQKGGAVSDLSVVKIGHTLGNPKDRLKSLQTGSPVPLVVLCYTRGGVDFERALHEKFAEHRSHREWFFVRGELELLLDALGEQCFGSTKVPSAAFRAILNSSGVLR